MCPDIMSTGFSGAESGHIRIGDTVAVFAQGPIGLCATAGARLAGLPRSLSVDAVPAAHGGFAASLARIMCIDFKKADPVDEIMRLTDGRGVDVAIEALGTQGTFEAALRGFCVPAAPCRASGSTLGSEDPARCRSPLVWQIRPS